MSIIHFDEPFLTIEWDEDAGAVWARWNGSPGSDGLRRGLEAGLELLVRKKSSKWLGDLRAMGVVAPDDAKWTSYDWTPRAIAAGLRWTALVMPRKVVTQQTTKAVTTYLGDRGVVSVEFSTPEDARAWLRTRP